MEEQQSKPTSSSEQSLDSDHQQAAVALGPPTHLLQDSNNVLPIELRDEILVHLSLDDIINLSNVDHFSWMLQVLSTQNHLIPTLRRREWRRIDREVQDPYCLRRRDLYRAYIAILSRGRMMSQDPQAWALTPPLLPNTTRLPIMSRLLGLTGLCSFTRLAQLLENPLLQQLDNYPGRYTLLVQTY